MAQQSQQHKGRLAGLLSPPRCINIRHPAFGGCPLHCRDPCESHSTPTRWSRNMVVHVKTACVQLYHRATIQLLFKRAAGLSQEQGTSKGLTGIINLWQPVKPATTCQQHGTRAHRNCERALLESPASQAFVNLTCCSHEELLYLSHHMPQW